MKSLKVTLAAMMIALFTVFGANKAQAQISTGEDIIAAAGNLVNVQIGDININAVDVVDVTNVLNNNDVDIALLNNIIRDVTLDNVLNNLLRDAGIIEDNQIVVGVVVDLLGNVTQVLVADKKSVRTKK